MKEKKVLYPRALKALPLPGTVKPFLKALYDAEFLLLTEGPREGIKPIRSYVKETADGLSKTLNSPEFEKKTLDFTILMVDGAGKVLPFLLLYQLDRPVEAAITYYVLDIIEEKLRGKRMALEEKGLKRNAEGRELEALL